jgi:quercetin dioxygenase-like cupin family protein
MVFGLLASVAVLVLSPAGVRTQGVASTHDLRGRPALEVNANLRIHKVMGQIGTFMVAEFAPGFKPAPHHHTHDQVNVGISGVYHVVTTTQPYQVSLLRGLLVPPDVQHGNQVTADALAPVLIEFQPVRRTDFPPERERVTFPMASTATPPPAENLELDFRAESAAWQRLPSGARVNAKKGIAAAVAAWEIPASAKVPIDIRSQLPAAELFVYVIDGLVEARAGSDRHAASAGILIVTPPGAPPLQVRSTGGGTSVLLVFEAAKPR